MSSSPRSATGAEPAILALDQGTSSSRAIVFGPDAILGRGQIELPQIYPADGLVEHDPETIWESVVVSARTALAEARHMGTRVAAIGLANQRETVMLWDRRDGRPLGNALVWQDRRTADQCRHLRAEGLEPLIQQKTGLLLDPYFSATKLAFMLEHWAGARAAALAGRLACGTVESFIIFRMTGGRVHATDAANASRTALYNLETGEWDDDLLRIFGVPRSILPEIRDNAGDFGVCDAEWFGERLPITGAAGDQQAALIGQTCFSPGTMKCTYGTGAFAMVNCGTERPFARNRLLATLAWRLNGRPTFAVEGSIFSAGSAVQWLRDGLGIIAASAETEFMAKDSDPAERVYFVPAFTGLGAPWWDAEARGAIFGLTRATNRLVLARAALEAACFQTADLLAAMVETGTGASEGSGLPALRVDGAMAGNAWAMQFLADILGIPVDRPLVLETTALGAAILARLGAGLSTEIHADHPLCRPDRRFVPQMAADTRARLLAGWRDAVERTLSRPDRRSGN